MLSKDLEVTLNLAFKEARAKRHEFMTVEHLLLALLDNSVAVDVLNSVGADITKLRKDLFEFIESTTPFLRETPRGKPSPRLVFNGFCSERFSTCSLPVAKK